MRSVHVARPGGCWVHFSSMLVPGHRHLAAGQDVRLDVETAAQDGYAFRATEVWTDEPAPEGTPPGLAHQSTAYRSVLTLSFDDESDRG